MILTFIQQVCATSFHKTGQFPTWSDFKIGEEHLQRDIPSFLPTKSPRQHGRQRVGKKLVLSKDFQNFPKRIKVKKKSSIEEHTTPAPPISPTLSPLVGIKYDPNFTLFKLS